MHVVGGVMGAPGRFYGGMMIDFIFFPGLSSSIESNLACPCRPDRRGTTGRICVFQPESN